MTRTTTNSPAITMPAVSPQEAFQEVQASFERFCLISGVAALEEMLAEDAQVLCGASHSRTPERRGHRWGTTEGPIGFHGGKAKVRRPRVRGKVGKEISLPSWTAAQEEDWLGKWAMNLMLINVSTRKFGRAVRLPEGNLPVEPGDGTSKSAASRPSTGWPASSTTRASIRIRATSARSVNCGCDGCSPAATPSNSGATDAAAKIRRTTLRYGRIA